MAPAFRDTLGQGDLGSEWSLSRSEPLLDKHRGFQLLGRSPKKCFSGGVQEQCTRVTGMVGVREFIGNTNPWTSPRPSPPDSEGWCQETACEPVPHVIVHPGWRASGSRDRGGEPQC